MPGLLKRILHFKICKAEINYSKLNPRNWKRPSFKKMIKGLAFLIIFLGAFIIVKDEISYQFDLGYYGEDYTDTDYSDDESDDICNVQGIELRGDLVTYISDSSIAEDGSQLYDETASDYILAMIEEAESDEEIKAIILEIDSYGGSAVAAEEVAKALKRSNKPTIVFVRSAATSAAYWAASGADIIFASALSDIGSIGVTMSYLDNTQKNKKDGLTYNSLSTGKFKDYGSPDKPLTEEEKKLIMRDLEITHNIFIKAVAENRNLPIEKVKLLADGSSMPGEMALENGLIDRIGDYYDAQTYLNESIGGKAEICW
ncbi:MAG: signal peptide peptidase SppA [Bacilli bacterium]|nr:signal peptide peptidase SppA [Bacilli bacterium]